MVMPGPEKKMAVQSPRGILEHSYQNHTVDYDYEYRHNSMAVQSPRGILEHSYHRGAKIILMIMNIVIIVWLGLNGFRAAQPKPFPGGKKGLNLATDSKTARSRKAPSPPEIRTLHLSIVDIVIIISVISLSS